MQIEFNANTVIVFDLDDTLYPEREYIQSGICYVIRFVQDLYNKTTYLPSLNIEDLAASNDFIQKIIEAYKLPETVKESLLWIYRVHKPSIKIKPQVSKLIASLTASCKAVIILTDGRSVTQRLKIESLGLSHLPAYISEEYFLEKPSPDRFLKIMNEFNCKNYVYVADNPQKDFLAPNSLAWMTIGLKGHQNNIYSQNLDKLPKEYWPNIWIDSLSDLLTL